MYSGKASATVPDDRLSAKLRKQDDITGEVVRWTRRYLSGRVMRPVVRGSH